MWLPGSRGASAEEETCTARLAQSPTSHSPCRLSKMDQSSTPLHIYDIMFSL